MAAGVRPVLIGGRARVGGGPDRGHRAPLVNVVGHVDGLPVRGDRDGVRGAADLDRWQGGVGGGPDRDHRARPGVCHVGDDPMSRARPSGRPPSVDCAGDRGGASYHGDDRGSGGQRCHPARPAAPGPGLGGEPGRSCAPQGPQGDGRPVSAVTLPDDVGYRQRLCLAGGLIGQVSQFVVQIRHWNTSPASYSRTGAVVSRRWGVRAARPRANRALTVPGRTPVSAAICSTVRSAR